MPGHRHAQKAQGPSAGHFTRRGEKELSLDTRITVEAAVIEAEARQEEEYPEFRTDPWTGVTTEGGQILLPKEVATTLARSADAIQEVGELRACRVNTQVMEDETEDQWKGLAAEEITRLVHTYKAMHPTTERPAGTKQAVSTHDRKVNEHGEVIKRRLRTTVNGKGMSEEESACSRLASQQAKLSVINLAVSGPRVGLGTLKMVTLDLKDFYLHPEHVLDKPEYCYVRADMLPDEYIREMGWDEYVVDGRLYMKITGAVYGLPLAG
jgi:hypothetical protein